MKIVRLFAVLFIGVCAGCVAPPVRYVTVPAQPIQTSPATAATTKPECVHFNGQRFCEDGSKLSEPVEAAHSETSVTPQAAPASSQVRQISPPRVVYLPACPLGTYPTYDYYGRRLCVVYRVVYGPPVYYGYGPWVGLRICFGCGRWHR